MNKVLKEKTMKAFGSVLPITIIVLIASVALVPMPSGNILLFIAGAALLIVGMGFFTLGADMALKPMGEGIGVQFAKRSQLFFVLVVSFVLGAIIITADPDLQIAAKQFDNVISYWHLAFTVALGMGYTLLIAVLRSLFKIRLSILLLVFYGIILGVSYFTPDLFIPISFESGAIATGPVVVPFVLAIGVGMASLRCNKNSLDESFGLLALAIIGPVLATLVMGIFHEPLGHEITAHVFPEVSTSRDVFKAFAVEMPIFFKEISLSMGCVFFCFIVFQIAFRRYHRHRLGRIAVGFLYTLIGLVLFFTGVKVGFTPMGIVFGSTLASSSYSWVLIPLGAALGYFLVIAEPDVFIFNKQVEEVTEGSITTKMMNGGLALGMAIALSISMARILFGIPLIWILLPGYVLALLLTFFVPRIFTAIAFDSGVVCSGPISVTFLLPFAFGVAQGAERDIMNYAVGIVAIVAMTPTVVIQLMGLLYQFKAKKAHALTDAMTASICNVTKYTAIDWDKITVFDEVI